MAVPARVVEAPLIAECHANFECRLKDDSLVERYNFFIFEVVKAHVAPRRNTRRRCTITATAYSWYRARSLAGVANSGQML